MPANVVYANVAEDQMCLLYGLYWPLDRPVDVDLNDVRTGDYENAASADPTIVDRLAADPGGTVSQTGTPGALTKQIDDGGTCSGCTRTGIDTIDQHPSDEQNVFGF
ncbi:MAG: hypothetical protein ACREQQ_10755 [Candidatus Binatia bacterium]